MQVEPFSLIYVTDTANGLDLFGDSIYIQQPVFEVIVVDSTYENKEEFVKNLRTKLHGQRFEYIHSPGCSLARAMNIGSVVVNTDKLVFVQGYSWLPPGWISNWLSFFSEYASNLIIYGSCSIHNVVGSESSYWKRVGEEIELREPFKWEMLHVFIPRYLFEYSNGIDERCITEEEVGSCVLAHSNWLGYQKVFDNRLRIGRIGYPCWNGVYKERVENPKVNITFNKRSNNRYSLNELRNCVMSP